MLRNVRDLELKGKRVFVRVDFNVPLKPGPNGSLTVADSRRIEGALPTIKFISDAGGRVILASHLGRPDGRPNPKYGMEPVADCLSGLLNKDVILTDDCIGDGVRGVVQQMRDGQILLLENLRFNPGEEENAVDFVNELKRITDIYISDAFGTLHRAHASTAGLPALCENRAMGFLVEKEMQFLMPLREAPKRPFALVMGGSKVSDKMGILEFFLNKADLVLVGGAMAYAFLSAQGKKIGRSLCDDKQVQLATRLLKSAAVRNVKLMLPVDHVVAKDPKNSNPHQTTPGVEIGDDWLGVDIGPKTIAAYREALKGMQTIFWNGPMGVFEVDEFSAGTRELAKAIGATKALKLCGGGDVAAAIEKTGQEAAFDFISTGGGATLEFLEGKTLPGLKALNTERIPEVFRQEDMGEEEEDP